MAASLAASPLRQRSGSPGCGRVPYDRTTAYPCRIETRGIEPPTTHGCGQPPGSTPWVRPAIVARDHHDDGPRRFGVPGVPGGGRGHGWARWPSVGCDSGDREPTGRLGCREPRRGARRLDADLVDRIAWTTSDSPSPCPRPSWPISTASRRSWWAIAMTSCTPTTCSREHRSTVGRPPTRAVRSTRPRQPSRPVGQYWWGRETTETPPRAATRLSARQDRSSGSRR